MYSMYPNVSDNVSFYRLALLYISLLIRLQNEISEFMIAVMFLVKCTEQLHFIEGVNMEKYYGKWL